LEDLKANFQHDMQIEFKNQSDRIDNILLKLSDRSVQFFDEKITFSNLLYLLSGQKLRESFEKDVVGDSLKDIDRLVSELVEWLAEKERRNLKNVVQHIKLQASSKADAIKSQSLARSYIQRLTSVLDQMQVGAEYQEGHDRVVDGIARQARQITEGFDRTKEAARLSSSVNTALLQTAAVEVGAIGLGSALAMSLFDLSGVVAVGALAVSGFAILPYKRSQIKKSMKEKVERLRKSLAGSLDMHFKSEFSRIEQRANDAVAPYVSFVKSEHQKLEQTIGELEQHKNNVASVKERITTTFPQE